MVDSAAEARLRAEARAKAAAIKPDADPLAAVQAAIDASKNKVSGKNAEIARIALEQAVNTGDTAAAVTAAKDIAKALGGGANVQAAKAIELLQEAYPKPTLNSANIARGDFVKWVGGANGSWQIIKGTNVVKTATTAAVTTAVTAAVTQFDWSGYKFDAGNRLYLEGNLFTGTYQGKKYVNGSLDTSSNDADIKTGNNIVTGTNLTSTQQDVMSTVLDRLNRYNLGSLAPLIKKLAIEGASEATIMLRLQDEPLYQERFKANQQRIKKGISVLTPSEYLNLEDSYRQILRAYGLNQFDNDAYVGQFISNDVSPAELSNRVVTAVQRVRNADPAVSNMLKNYYGIGQNDLVAYVLDPNQQFQKIERQVAASEIGVAAGRQGINIGVPVAEQLAAQGITQAEAQRGYATIADILPTAEKLSGIYGTTLDKYGLAEGEQEQFNSLASAQRKRQRLIGREVAEFSGQSGISRGALGTSTGGQY